MCYNIVYAFLSSQGEAVRLDSKTQLCRSLCTPLGCLCLLTAVNNTATVVSCDCHHNGGKFSGLKQQGCVSSSSGAQNSEMKVWTGLHGPGDSQESGSHSLPASSGGWLFQLLGYSESWLPFILLPFPRLGGNTLR